jgi:hypothetical protein
MRTRERENEYIKGKMFHYLCAGGTWRISRCIFTVANCNLCACDHSESAEHGSGFVRICKVTRPRAHFDVLSLYSPAQIV